MALITLLSDFGTRDHYAAALKARILSINPGLRIVDISHNVKHFDIAHGASLLSAVFRDFPKGTVHLCAIDSAGINERFIALRLEEHYFLGSDNGLVGLISNQTAQAVVELPVPRDYSLTFPAKDILAPAAAQLASTSDIHVLGKKAPDYKRMIPRLSRASKKMISGHVVHVDHYGNLITNIRQADFEVLSKDKTYTVNFGREKLDKVHQHYTDTDDGDCSLVFNAQGFLEIAINKGNASELLGLDVDSPVNIIFPE
jgi:hypothetical protein